MKPLPDPDPESTRSASGSLFRREVIAARSLQALGPLFMNVPVRMVWIGWGAVFFCMLLGTYLAMASFSEKVIVPGYVDVKPGVVQIYPKRSGIVLKSMVKIGQHVKKGEVLFVIKTGFDQLQKQESKTLQTFEYLEKSMLRDVERKKQHLTRLKQLALNHHISIWEYEQQKRVLLNAIQQAVEIGERRIQVKLDHAYVLLAPIDGKVSDLPVSMGTFVKGDKPLLKLIPNHATWIATLLVPVQFIRFVHPHAQVTLRYDAYPYIRYGTNEGRIEAFSQTIGLAGDQQHPIATQSPYYQVEVALLNPWKHLRQGMTLSAVLMGEKRSAFQWLRDLR